MSERKIIPYRSLAERMKESETDSYLLMGPTPPYPGYVYRDFRAMPRDMWLNLIDIIGDENIKVCAADQRQLPPAEMCRAQIFISPKGQENWSNYLKTNTH